MRLVNSQTKVGQKIEMDYVEGKGSRSQHGNNQCLMEEEV